MTQAKGVIVTGVGGRMGLALREALGQAPDLFLAASVEHEGHPFVGSELDGVPVVSDLAAVVDRGVAVVDFTAPDAAAEYAETCAAAGVPFVSGTTGLSEAQRSALEACAARIPLLLAPNMSVGVNLLFRLVAEAAAALCEGFDAEVVEIHHRFKKDAPSGTAARIADILREATGGPLVHGREGLVGPRSSGEVGVHALRGGDVVGEHTVVFAGLGERLELTHRAHSRATFAEGALRAARFLQGKAPGLYSMKDVLGL